MHKNSITLTPEVTGIRVLYCAIKGRAALTFNTCSSRASLLWTPLSHTLFCDLYTFYNLVRHRTLTQERTPFFWLLEQTQIMNGDLEKSETVLRKSLTSDSHLLIWEELPGFSRACLEEITCRKSGIAVYQRTAKWVDFPVVDRSRMKEFQGALLSCASFCNSHMLCLF